MQATVRTSDYRRLWKRKANLQMIAVPIGAILGSLPYLMDSPSLKTEQELPTNVIEGAIWVSTLVNGVNYWFYS